MDISETNRLGLSRRQCVALGLGAAVAPALIAAAGPEPSLASLARAKGLRFGSAVGAGPVGSPTGSFEDPRYRQLLAAECGALVPENELKWYVLRPDAATFAFARADRIAAFAQEHQLALRGHCLLWHHPRWFPAWLNTHDFGPQPAVAAEKLLVDHIDAVCGRYPQIDSWDVVNETVDPDTGGPRETSLSKAMGQRVLDVAFHAARAAAPKARLVYNDYMGWDVADAKHRAGVLKLLEGFKARGVPVDALGVQGHIGAPAEGGAGTGFGKPQEKAWRDFLDQVTGMGYDLLITEFDINDKGLPGDIAVRDKAVADYGRTYLDLMLSYPQVKEVMAWGLVDKYSWLRNLSPRADGLAKRPTLYDDACSPSRRREGEHAFLDPPDGDAVGPGGRWPRGRRAGWRQRRPLRLVFLRGPRSGRRPGQARAGAVPQPDPQRLLS
jgi:endo-1,4-beta-xylanase